MNKEPSKPVIYIVRYGNLTFTGPMDDCLGIIKTWMVTYEWVRERAQVARVDLQMNEVIISTQSD